jgi:hypothetical protein
VNKVFEHESFEERDLRLPSIKELHSIFVGEERMVREKDG